MHWINIEDEKLGFSNVISESVPRAVAKHTTTSDLRPAEALLIASDWSGLHKDAQFEVSSHLLVGSDHIRTWDAARLQSREVFAPAGRRMSFKNLGDKERAAHLPSFVAAADLLPGLLLTTAYDKSIDTLFGVSKLAPNQLEGTPLASWPLKTAERGMRAFHAVGMLLRGLSGPGQHVLWVADQDDIFANQVRHAEAVQACGNVMTHYLMHSLGHVRVATTQSDTGRLDLEDIASIPDLAAGAVQSYLQTSSFVLNAPNTFHARPEHVPDKTKAIFNWLSDSRSSLVKVVLAIHEKNNRLVCSTLNLLGTEKLKSE